MPIKGSKGKFEYSKVLFSKSEKRRKTPDNRIHVAYLNDLIESFPNVFKNLEREVKFCPIEKCAIETEEGKIIVKRGTVVPQAKEGQA